jgi:hypothetical protein
MNWQGRAGCGGARAWLFFRPRSWTASLRDFGDKPLAVLTAGVGHDAAWMTAQNKTATLSANSVHRVIAGATHEALVAEQKYAGATTRAILDVVNSVRHHRPLDR